MRGGHKRKTIERTNAERGREREREEEPGEQLYKEKEQSSDQKKRPTADWPRRKSSKTQYELDEKPNETDASWLKKKDG